MQETSTPLSDCITQLIRSDTPENYDHFIRVFMNSQLGVVVHGLPEGAEGKYVDEKGELRVSTSKLPDGREVLLACADFVVFRRRFNPRFNAEMDATALLKVALANPDCEGILVNSAASEHSAVIYRKDIPRLII